MAGRTIRGRAPAVADGLSEDEAVAADPLADYSSTFDWYFINAERMTRTFFKDLTGK